MSHFNIDFCALKDHHNHNGRSMVLFTGPKKLKERVRRVKDGECNDKKNSKKICQNEVWMHATNHGCANGSTGHSENARHRTCLHHFDPIVITCDSNDRCPFKI